MFKDIQKHKKNVTFVSETSTNRLNSCNRKKTIEKSRECHSHNRSQPSTPRGREKGQKHTHAKKQQQTNVRETQRPAPSSPSEVIRMLKQTEKRGQRAREDFKTLSAPWYKPQSYAELRTKPGPPSNRGAGGGEVKIFLPVDILHLWSRCNS